MKGNLHLSLLIYLLSNSLLYQINLHKNDKDDATWLHKKASTIKAEQPVLSNKPDWVVLVGANPKDLFPLERQLFFRSKVATIT